MGMIDELVQATYEIARYTGEDPSAVLSKTLDGTRRMADEWNVWHPQTEEQVTAFYHLCRTQIYAMVGYNYCNPSRHLLSLKIAERCYGRVLDFGAGVGDNLIRLWARGLHCLTHVDFAGYTRAFAAQRYAARGMEVTLVEPHEIKGQFDCIICLDVVEHAPDPAAMLGQLTSHLATGGKLFLNIHFGRGEDHPMHFERPAAFDEMAHLASLGLCRSSIVTARDLLIDVKTEAERQITAAEWRQLLRAFPGNLDLLFLCLALPGPVQMPAPSHQGEVCHA